MIKRLFIGIRIVLLLFALAALALAMSPTPSRAFNCSTATDCTDTDSDGLTDREECDGISLSGAFIPSCIGTGLSEPNCVHPEFKDVLVVLARNPLSNRIPNNPSLWFNALDIYYHEITSSQLIGADRQVTSVRTISCGDETKTTGMKAVKVVERIESSPYIGITWPPQGPPTVSNIEGKVYTAQIQQLIDDICVKVSGPEKCRDISGPDRTDADGSGIADLDEFYITHTIMHEIGHILHLGETCIDSMGGCHYMPDEELLMSQYVTYQSKKGGKEIIFHIGQDWKPTVDPPNAALVTPVY